MEYIASDFYSFGTGSLGFAKIWFNVKKGYSAKITPDEDTRPEYRNVGSWIITSLGYVHNFLQTRVALYYVWSFTWLPWTCILPLSLKCLWNEIFDFDFLAVLGIFEVVKTVSWFISNVDH